MNTYTKPRIGHSVLITIDTQNDFTLNGAPAQIAGTKEVIQNMVRLLETYRRKGLPIVHVIRLYLPNGSNVDLCRKQAIEEGTEIVTPGSEGAELVHALKPDPAAKNNATDLLSGQLQKIGPNEYIMYKPDGERSMARA